MENTSEFYYEKLKSSDNPGAILAAMYSVLYDIPVSKKETIMCNKMVKVFGRYITFFSILDMAGSYHIQPETPLPLLYTICKRRFESTHIDSSVQSRQSLVSYVADMRKEIEMVNKQKAKIPSSEGLEKDV
jgi:hypothetical protein